MGTTKELILEEAFNFFGDSRNVDFSLSQLAEKVGISKPAIYRHFSSKGALVEEMRNHFMDLIADRFDEGRRISEESGIPFFKAIFINSVEFFVGHPELISYFIVQFSYDCNFSDLCRHVVSKKCSECGVEISGVHKNSEIFFCSTAILFFIKVREGMLRGAVGCGDFPEKLWNFLDGGFASFAREGDVLFPVPIDDGRRKELLELCRIDANVFPDEDRIFTALASVIKREGLPNVTVEKIASELGMAKSSLYFYFDNKNHMVRKLIDREFQVLVELVRENSIEARNFSEFIYISMHTELNYFLCRPSLLPICGWILRTSSEDRGEKEIEVMNIWEKRMHMTGECDKIDLGFRFLPELISYWSGLLPVSLVFKNDEFGLCEEELRGIVDEMFGFMQFGIK